MAQTKKNDSKDDAPVVAGGAAAGPVINEPLVIPDMTFSPNPDAAGDDERHTTAEAEHLAHLMTDTQVTIEKNVPMPIKGQRRLKEKYPFGGLEPGDSFAIPCEAAGVAKLQARLGAAAAYRQKRFPGCRFATRQVEENGKRVVRVWRTA